MMKQFWTQITPLPRTAKLLGLTLLTATVLTTTPALALEYTEADAAAGSFGKPTSVKPVTVVGGSNIYETDVSKNAAYIPPAFGSPMADMPGSGERLTPNLLTGGIWKAARQVAALLALLRSCRLPQKRPRTAALLGAAAIPL